MQRSAPINAQKLSFLFVLAKDFTWPKGQWQKLTIIEPIKLCANKLKSQLFVLLVMQSFSPSSALSSRYQKALLSSVLTVVIVVVVVIKLVRLSAG